MDFVTYYDAVTSLFEHAGSKLKRELDIHAAVEDLHIYRVFQNHK
jgi:hypothetical protein